MRIVVLAILLLLFLSASLSMDVEDWVITVLRGLSVGAIVFLVAAGFSLILGLMDVLNLAHGELFMVGAYVGWTVYVRPDTFVDSVTPMALLAAGLVLLPVLTVLIGRWWGGGTATSPSLGAGSLLLPLLALIMALVILFFSFSQWPIAKWNPELFQESPATYALAFSQGTMQIPEPAVAAGLPPTVLMLGMLLGGMLLAAAVVGMKMRGKTAVTLQRLNKNPIILSIALVITGVVVFLANDVLTNWLFGLNTTVLFMVAIVVATLVGAMIGGLVEATLIRPLYDRPIYQIMLTLGIGFIGIEMVRAVWGRPEFTMPKPALFARTGDGCPAVGIGDWLAHQCSTIFFLDARVRTYNEIFVILVGLIVLIGVWLIIQRTRLGMIIRAGVQDSEMVEAMGINVRRVFTLVFAMGVGLAALGGVLAAPSIGLSNAMGGRFLLLALIALAIGGLTSYPGAAAGSVLVGLMQQFIIKYGQIGINLPFLAEPFKPSPPLVPASTVLLMVIILLILPHGLFGREE
jgi:branched-chain amino acid transport system permease protein